MKLITKKTVKVGNSAGVVLPADWLNGIVQVKLVQAPLSQNDLFNQLLIVLKDKLLDMESLAIMGSYARGEEEGDSDIDVLVITKNENNHTKIGKFDILFLSEKKLKEDLEKNALPLLPMLKESKPIINGHLIHEYAKNRLTKKNLKWHIDTTKSAIAMVKHDIDFSKEINENISDASAYSLILRLRTLYIVDCLRKNKLWKKKEFLNIVKKISGSLSAYEGYLRVKNKGKKKRSNFKIDEAEKLIKYINTGLIRIEKWLSVKKG